LLLKELLKGLVLLKELPKEVVTWGAQSGDKGCVQRIGDMGCSKVVTQGIGDKDCSEW
jgi:hypothetical protein